MKRTLFSLALLGGLFFPVFSLNLNFSNEELIIEQKDIPDTTINSIHYTSAKLLELFFKTKGKYDPSTIKYILEDSYGEKWTMVPGGTFILVGKEVIHFPYPVQRSATEIFLPTSEMINILKSKYFARLTYKPEQGIINYDIGTGNILKIFHQVKDNGSLIKIQTTKNLSFESLWVYPHFIINIEKGRLNSELLLPMEYKRGLVKKISTIQDTSVAQITLYIPNPIDTVNTLVNKSANIISVIVRKPDKQKLLAIAVAKTEKKPRSRKTIIIDPGHGGKDPGSQFKGIYEKSITLYIAKQLEKELKKRNYKVLLTRTGDKYVALKKRPAFAAKNGGDLFISLHCNAVSGTPKKQKTVNGFVAYILRAGQSKEDKALARRENQAIKETTKKKNKTEISIVEWILLEHELNLYSRQSEEFAEKIVEAFLGGKLQKHRTGAHQAGFFVLVGSFMPAVLFEMGFITNDKDRRFMSSKKGQKYIALSLSKAVHMYFEGKN